jgi:hypothetical protein
VWACALSAVLLTSTTTQAAWDNVFQVCCNNCGKQVVGASPVVALSPAADPCCPQPCCPPQQCCTTRYVQRCFYQPVTTYRTSFYYEPVTTYRTSYYYEPVTTYRTSYSFDPCCCCYKASCCPVTCYQLRSQCCPVTSCVKRCSMTPCTTYQLSYYYEPQTTCCTTTTGAPVLAVPQGGTTVVPPVAAPGALPGGVPGGVPSVTEQSQTAPPPVAPPQPAGPSVSESTIPAAPGSYRQPQLGKPLPALPTAPVQPSSHPVPVRLDRIVSLSAHTVEGRVVNADRAPQGNARLLFVSAGRDRSQHSLMADGSGQFQVSLASGNWLVYVRDADGRPVFQQKLDVSARAGTPMLLVSR